MIAFVTFILVLSFLFLKNGINNYGVPLLVIGIGIIILFFAIGHYWFFQKVIFSEQGILIVLGNKKIKDCSWDEIISIEKWHNNRSLRIKLVDGYKIRLDLRKSIISTIELFSKKIIL